MSLPPVGHWQQIGVLLAANPAIGAASPPVTLPGSAARRPGTRRVTRLAGACGLERLFDLHCLTSLARPPRPPGRG